jgi:dTDP-4-dehydrorhamnose reductase
MLGRELAAEFPGALGLDLPDLDIRDEDAVRAVFAAERPEVVLNAAADTRVDLAESDGAHASVNDDAVGVLARAAAASGITLAHVSTDYVFSGRGARPWREDDPVDPVNAYGRGKLGGERRFLESGARGFVVRTSWLFGASGPNFVDAILKQAEAGKSELKVVADQEGRPTYAPDLARAIRLLVEKEAAGLVHFANAGATTWYTFAREALRLAGFENVVVHPCATSDFPRPARRPAYSVLDTALYEKTAGERPRAFVETLPDYLAVRAAKRAQSAGAPVPGDAPIQPAGPTQAT